MRVGAVALFGFAFLWGCTQDDPVVCDTAECTVDTPIVEPPQSTYAWTMETLSDDTITQIGTVHSSIRARANDGLYLWGDLGLGTWTPGYLRRSGEYCVGTLVDDSCDGIAIRAGFIETEGVLSVCEDPLHDDLLLLMESGNIQRLGSSRGGPDWHTYNRIHGIYRPLEEDSFVASGPCQWLSEDLIRTSANQIQRLHISAEGTYTIEASASLADQPAELAWLDPWLVLRTDDGKVTLRDPSTLELVNEVSPDSVQDLAVDSERGVLWLGTESEVQRVQLDGDGKTTRTAVPMDTPVQRLDINLATGMAHVLAGQESNPTLYLVDEEEILSEIQVGAAVLDMIPSGHVGDAALVLADGVEPRLSVFRALETPQSRPPLNAFIVSTLEEPFNQADKACTAEENPDDYFDAYIERLRSNVDRLAETDLPIAVGVTREFLRKAIDCGHVSILDDLTAKGLDLGVMVHSRPCYNCTRGTVEGVVASQCEPSDPNYKPSTSTNACWPDHEDYCRPGDQDCWLSYISTVVLEVDTAIPGGASFVHGADRHVIWDWDWIDGFRHLPRADGSQGYSTTLMVSALTYKGTVSADDPRSKEPAPWVPDRVSTTWQAASVDDWTEPSAFSELTVMPGISVALLKNHEWQSSGLPLLSLGAARIGITLNKADLNTATGLLSHAIKRRGTSSSTWYIHLRDLTTWDVIDHTIDGQPADVALGDWWDELNDTWGPTGHQTMQNRLPRDMSSP